METSWIDKIGLWIASFFRKILRVFKCDLSEDSFARLLQFAKYGVVGLINNLVCYLVYLALIPWMHYVPAMVIGFTVSVINSYYWNNKYVFHSDEKRVWWKTFLKTYIAYSVTGILLNSLLLLFWIEVCGMSRVLAPVINLFITVPASYVINKLWAYK